MSNLEETMPNQDVFVLVGIMSRQNYPGDSVEKFDLSKDSSDEFDSFSINMAILRLERKEMIKRDQNIQSIAFYITNKGEDWLLENENRLSSLVVSNVKKSPF